MPFNQINDVKLISLILYEFFTFFILYFNFFYFFISLFCISIDEDFGITMRVIKNSCNYFCTCYLYRFLTIKLQRKTSKEVKCLLYEEEGVIISSHFA